VSSAPGAVKETVSTLRFLQSAKRIRNTVRLDALSFLSVAAPSKHVMEALRSKFVSFSKDAPQKVVPLIPRR